MHRYFTVYTHTKPHCSSDLSPAQTERGLDLTPRGLLTKSLHGDSLKHQRWHESHVQRLGIAPQGQQRRPIAQNASPCNVTPRLPLTSTHVCSAPHPPHSVFPLISAALSYISLSSRRDSPPLPTILTSLCSSSLFVARHAPAAGRTLSNTLLGD